VPSERIFTSSPPDPDLRLAYGDDPNQFIDIRVPTGNGPSPVVFFIHGGYWRAKYDLTHAGHLCHALKQAGIATLNVEYRRVGNPGGGWPGTLNDLRSAYHFLCSDEAKHKLPQLDLNRLCVAGHSAGGQLALCLAAHEPAITRVVSLAGVLDLRRAWELHLSNDAVAEFLGGSPSEVPDRYREASPAEQHIAAKQILIHGTADGDVPYELSRKYAEQKTKSGEDVRLITMQDTGHFEIVDPASRVWSSVQQLFTDFTRA
jgi:acetyl esterase/lipase